MNPNIRLNLLQLSDFIEVFQKEIDDFCTYKAINLDEDKLIKMLSLMYNMTRNKFNNLAVNDVAIAIGNLYYEDIKKVSPEVLMKALQNASNKKSIKAESEENEQYKEFKWSCEYGRALTLRVKHDPGGKILEQNGHTYMDVVESVKKGFNYYTGERVNLDKPESLVIKVGDR